MLRELARMREAQGNTSSAARYRALAAEMARQTLVASYTSDSASGHGWFNVLYDNTNGTGDLTAYEMRHVVDFFSVVIGMCSGPEAECDLSQQQRNELGAWFREESVTSTWVRATSPRTNCSRSWPVKRPGNNGTMNVDGDATTARRTETADVRTFGSERSEESSEFPAYATCAAGRPDHGSDGAYPSWPAFALEALCYVDGNCSSAFEILGTFADNTLEGPFGQVGATTSFLAWLSCMCRLAFL